MTFIITVLTWTGLLVWFSAFVLGLAWLRDRIVEWQR